MVASVGTSGSERDLAVALSFPRHTHHQFGNPEARIEDLQPTTHDVHPAVRHVCALVVSLTERMQPDCSPLKPAPGSSWQPDVDRLASSLTAEHNSQERVRLSVLFGSEMLLGASVDYAKGMAHAIAGGSLYSGHVLARCVSEGIGRFRWMVEHPTDGSVLLCRALLVLGKSHQHEASRLRRTVAAGETDPVVDLQELRDSHASKASELLKFAQRLDAAASLPRESVLVADLSRATSLSDFPTIEFGIASAFTHLEPIVLFNSLDYESEKSEGQWLRTMSVSSMLLPVLIVNTALRHASQMAASLFEFTIGTDLFDAIEAELLQAFVNHGDEQGADLRLD